MYVSYRKNFLCFKIQADVCCVFLLAELTETFDVFIKEVPPQQRKQLMETVLQENDMDEIISKFPNNREEQSYQMLLIWRNRLGQKQCIIKVLDSLRHTDTKAYNSISKTLRSNNIIS